MLRARTGSRSPVRCSGRQSGQRIRLHRLPAAPGRAVRRHWLSADRMAFITRRSTTSRGSPSLAIPHLSIEQEMARVYGLEAIRMASADVLPFNYQDYGKEIGEYVKAANEGEEDLRRTGAIVCRCLESRGPLGESRGRRVEAAERDVGDPGGVNLILRNTERAFLIAGLPVVRGSSTRSMRPASTPDTPPWLFRESTRPSTRRT